MTELEDNLGESDDVREYYAYRKFITEAYLPRVLAASGIDFSNMTAFEIGCGRGTKSKVLAGSFRRYVGIDLDSKELHLAAKAAKNARLQNCEFYRGNFLEALENPTRFGLSGEPDFLILYAALEHMLAHERQQALDLARRVVDRGGAVLIAETPNRLIPFDSHSSQQHFTQSLPPDLALRYVQGSGHDLWMRSLRRMGGDITALHRCGLGLSYHDFELDFARQPSTLEMPFAVTGWCNALVSHQPLQNDEVWLHQYLAEHKLPVHPAFARYWIEGLLSKSAPLIHRWTRIARLIASHPSTHTERSAYWALGQWNVSPRQSIWAEFYDAAPADFYEYILQMDLTLSSGTIIFDADGAMSTEIDLEALKRARVGAWHQVLVATIKLPTLSSKIAIKPADAGSHIGLQALILNGYSRTGSPY